MDDALAARSAEAVNAEARPVTISGNVVTRPASSTSGTVHAFLGHLRGKGLICVPEPLGIDDDRVERLV
ncbi:MAG: hypothetical protein M3Y35_18505, partial [Actinomycetota bacterium]|nr:hypothetical protein [Actinomycetota bacterium]